MSRLNGIVVASLATTLVAGNASAVVIAEYTFTGGSLDSSDTEGSTSASAISYNAWINHPSYPGGDTPVISDDKFLARTSVTNPSAATGSADLDDAIAADNFIEFTITGTDFDVASVSFDYEVSGVNTYKYRAFVLSDVTGSTAQGMSVELQSTDANDDVVATANIASDWENLNSLTVRIYLADSTFNTNGFHFIDNILVQGTPEPGTLALVGLGGVCLIKRRRRA